MTWRLVTIRPSHYNEKARWALDRCGHAYVEEPWMPMLHVLGSARVLVPRRAGRADGVSTRLSTPILVAGERVLSDSTDIVAFAAAQTQDPRQALYWSSEAIALDRQFSGRFGADTRKLAYFYLLPDQALVEELALRSVDAVQAQAWIALSPVIKRLLIDKLQISPDKAARARERIRAEFAAVSERLADGRPYLLGDRFSAADLSFAALGSLAVLVGPDEGYGAWLPARERAPAEYRALADELRATAAGQHILRMFAQERRAPVPRPLSR